MTRETKLNNPMGLKHSKDNFIGEFDGGDPVFKAFNTAENGIRAGVKTLLAYFTKHSLRTVTSIIHRWAPPSENNTSSYIDDVCDRMGVQADEVLDLWRADEMASLCAAIIHHENGGEPYAHETILAGVTSAYA